MALRRWTPLTFLLPTQYIDTERNWTEFDLLEWADEEYEWTSDPWTGFWDFAKRPVDTIDEGRGDCEDFALVAASWAVANDRSPVGLGFCWQRNRPWPTHAIAFDRECVYSSGAVTQESVDEWRADSPYAVVLRRRVA